MFGEDIKQYAFIILIALSVGGLMLAVLYPLFRDKTAEKRFQSFASNDKSQTRQSLRSRLSDDPKEARRRQIQESLNQSKVTSKQKKRIDLRTLLSQAGLSMSVKMFWVISFICGALLAFIPFTFGLSIYITIGAAFIGVMGLPRWILKFMRNRRQNIFLTDLADAIDVLVRGLKSGLPINDAMRVIANESGPPVGPEFAEIIEGQKLGIPIDVGVEKLYERMPLPEVNFLAIVMSIQAKTGGNLSEALANLSKVLRDRKKMKSKVKAVSQEAKSSAAIIGALPFIVSGVILVFNPEYMDPLFHTTLGYICLFGSAVWMITGVVVMINMINIDI